MLRLIPPYVRKTLLEKNCLEPCVISRVNKDGTTTQIDRWVSEEGKITR